MRISDGSDLRATSRPALPGRARQGPGIAGRAGVALLAAVAVLAGASVARTPPPMARIAQATLVESRTPIVERHAEAARGEAAGQPRSEGDQAVVDGWPLYRTPRGQAAFNAAMATLAATRHAAPPDKATFEACPELACDLELPTADDDGWLPTGRAWVAPNAFVIIARSPRDDGRSHRHGRRGMRYFVLHEFHNGSRNIDPYDTISSHSGSVFVPFYMSKTRRDAEGRRFVVIIQIAPLDVVSNHATNWGSAGPGVEVAKNFNEDLEPLQARAGVLLAAMLKRAAPQLEVVNHRGEEGRPMLTAWKERLAAMRERGGSAAMRLPFVPASERRIARAVAELGDLVLLPGASPRIPVAERGIVPPGAARTAAAAAGDAGEPRLVGSARSARQGGEPAPALVEPITEAVRPSGGQ